MSKRDLLSIADLSAGELGDLLELAIRMRGRHHDHMLTGKTLGLLFFDRSLRTRVSFEVGMVQLGGHCINIVADRELYGMEPEAKAVMDGSAEEHVVDAARTLSRYVDALGVRQASATGPWERDREELMLRTYAEAASVPVINCESIMEHPCQALADVLTIRDNLLSAKGRRLTLAWSDHPDPKPMGPTHSVLLAAASLGMEVTVAHPLGFELDEELMGVAEQRAQDSGGAVQVVNDLQEGAKGAEVVYARAWGSKKYWEDPEREAMVKRGLHSWRIDKALMDTTDNALFMHPLPVRRNVVVTDEVLDGPRSVVYDQAENRLHVQKALLVQLLR